MVFFKKTETEKRLLIMMIRQYKKEDLPSMIRIWNEVVEEGIAFPQDDLLDFNTADEFFSSQSYTGVAEDFGRIV